MDEYGEVALGVTSKWLHEFVKNALIEDVGSGDHSGLSCLDPSSQAQANLLVKASGTLAGIQVARYIYENFCTYGESNFQLFIDDGMQVSKGDLAFSVQASVLDLLRLERIVLNVMGRMSGIATATHAMVSIIDGLHTKVLDTRKTTPNQRPLEKWAVRLGGGQNHRFGLYDMIMLKDNHIDAAGGISKAVELANQYKAKNNLQIPIEVECRSLSDVTASLVCEGVSRIMFDNFTPSLVAVGVAMVKQRVETEASGNITLSTIRDYALTGVDFVSTGSITHSAPSLDLSLKLS